MRKMNITIKDVAAEAGVSVATVSRVLNGNAKVSKETERKVGNAVGKLGYSPNRLARNLRKSETNMILAVIPSFETPFYGRIIIGMQEIASENEYDIMVCMSNSNLATEMRLLNMLFNRTVDAAVLLGTELDAKTLNEINKDFYIALCCERVEGAEVFTVTVDDVAGAYYATKNFISCGHSKIAMVSTLRTLSSKDRECGYRKALEDNGINYREDYVYRGNYDYSNGAEAFNKFMHLKDPPTAIFCVSDVLAFGIAKQAVKRGYGVGTDISVCGFDNLSFSGMYSPAVTTVEQPSFEIGRTAVEEIIYAMRGGAKSKRHVTLNFEFIARDSVKPLPPEV
jgi:LacI family transcriptional regulator/LacI family repressor for deo operon, udp, cdd, tsx, nupC, and nupG